MYSMLTSCSSAPWRRADGPVLFSAGSMPYVARDLMQFPVVEPADGTLDIVIQSLASRMPARRPLPPNFPHRRRGKRWWKQYSKLPKVTNIGYRQ